MARLQESCKENCANHHASSGHILPDLDSCCGYMVGCQCCLGSCCGGCCLECGCDLGIRWQFERSADLSCLGRCHNLYYSHCGQCYFQCCYKNNWICYITRCQQRNWISCCVRWYCCCTWWITQTSACCGCKRRCIKLSNQSCIKRCKHDQQRHSIWRHQCCEPKSI